MTIVAARRYIEGRVQDLPVAVDGAPREPLERGTFDWIGLAEPTPAEMEAIARQFGLHPLAVEDSLNPNHPPKIELYGHQLFVVARTAALGPGDMISYGQTALFLGSDFLVSVRQGSTRAHLELRQSLEAHPERLAEGPDYVLHAVLDFIVDGYSPLIDELEGALVGIEESAIDAFPDPGTIRRIFRLRRQLRRFERVVGPMQEVCERLALTELPAVDPSARVWFRDVLDHVRRAMARVLGLKETLASIVETASLLDQHRQGTMTRSLAAWAAILAVPTAIAGIYGMNFDRFFLPEHADWWGFPATVGLMAAVCALLWVRFRRIGWL
ncbi:MAG TPA: magnesium and cobalt transport protein CorA [Novosphingobium sp.]|nr:magnesium and cobalt transport protein CorA [Novosphingobium sp.]